MQCFQGQNLFHKDKKVISPIIWQPFYPNTSLVCESRHSLLHSP